MIPEDILDHKQQLMHIIKYRGICKNIRCRNCILRLHCKRSPRRIFAQAMEEAAKLSPEEWLEV